MGINRPPRPRSVTWLLLLVLSFTGSNFLRFLVVLESWNLLSDLPLTLSPFVLAFIGLFWTVVGSGIALGLWRGSGWASLAARLAALAYAFFIWLDRLLLSASPLRSDNWTFALAATLILLGFALKTLTHPEARAYFGEKDE